MEYPCPFESFAIFFFLSTRDLGLRRRGREVSSTRENRRGSQYAAAGEKVGKRSKRKGLHILLVGENA